MTMKKIYVIPTIEIEDIEIGGLMDAGASQWKISGDNAALDNKDIKPGNGITGGDNNGETPGEGDSKGGNGFFWFDLGSKWSD